MYFFLFGYDSIAYLLDLHFALQPLAFNTVNINAVERDEVYATLSITLKDRPDTPVTLRVKVDTGAQVNVMPLRTFQCMYPSNIDTEGILVRRSLEHRDTILTAYNGQLIRQYGTILRD